MSELGILAEQIIDDELPFLEGGEKSLAISRASGWLENNIGQLNNRIFTSYSGQNPGLKYEESVIYKNIYLNSYYKSKAGSVLKNMDSSTLQWLSLKEGDSQIQLQNKNEVAKTYLQLAKQNEEELKHLIWTYNLYQAYPRQVDIVYDYREDSASEESYNIESFEAMGSINIPSGTKELFVPLSLESDPKRISLSLIKPSGTSSNFTYSVVGNGLSSTGFFVSLGATINTNGYKINYGVK